MCDPTTQQIWDVGKNSSHVYTEPEKYMHTPDSKFHGAIIGPFSGRQDPGGPHVDPMNFAIWDVFQIAGRLWNDNAQTLVVSLHKVSVMRVFDILSDVILSKLLNKQ